MAGPADPRRCGAQLKSRRKDRAHRALRCLASLALLLTTGAAVARDRPLVWALHGPTNTVYIAGSMHLLRPEDSLLPSAIEEVLRYRAPLQWVMRAPRRAVQVNGQTIPAGKLTLAVIGSANRDPKVFSEPNRFNVTRNPNPHLAFGHGIHSCLGAALARMEAKIALREFFESFANFELANAEPWQPRKALHVLGPTNLSLRIKQRNQDRC